MAQLFGRGVMKDSELNEIDFMIRQAWDQLGPPVAKTLVESFDTKSEYGANLQDDSIEAFLRHARHPPSRA